nr:hypothetical protein [Tanacetum cinerariifolium]
MFLQRLLVENNGLRRSSINLEVSQTSSSYYEYVIAVNGSDGDTTDFNQTYQQELPPSSLDMTKNVSNANIMQTHSDIMTLNVQAASSGVTAQL